MRGSGLVCLVASAFLFNATFLVEQDRALAQDYYTQPGSPVDTILDLIIGLNNFPVPSVDAKAVRVETQYDARGQVLRRSQPYYLGESVR